MSNYALFSRLSAVNTLATVQAVRPVPVSEQTSLAVVTGNLMDPNLAITPPDQQAFQLVVTGTGAVSASAQVYGSNDNAHWVSIGNVITASGTASATAGGAGTVGFAFFKGVLTAISGINAQASMVMNA